MARGLDPSELTELSQFVNDLAKLAGWKTSAAWAAEANYPESNLSNLRGAKAGVDGYNLLRLIQASAERARLEPTGLALSVAKLSTNALLRSLEAAVAEQGKAAEEALRALAAEVALLRTRLEGKSEPPTQEEAS